jgi:hypothetical protein
MTNETLPEGSDRWSKWRLQGWLDRKRTGSAKSAKDSPAECPYRDMPDADRRVPEWNAGWDLAGPTEETEKAPKKGKGGHGKGRGTSDNLESPFDGEGS